MKPELFRHVVCMGAAVSVAVAPAIAWAQCTAQPPPAFVSCFEQAGAHYDVDPNLLRAIAEVESGWNPQAINGANGNGTEDLGISQINSDWLPTLKAYNIDRDTLMNPCVNIHVSAWVLAQNTKTFGATWRAVGAYNAATEAKREAYVKRVWEAYQKCSSSLG